MVRHPILPPPPARVHDGYLRAAQEVHRMCSTRPPKASYEPVPTISCPGYRMECFQQRTTRRSKNSAFASPAGSPPRSFPLFRKWEIKQDRAALFRCKQWHDHSLNSGTNCLDGEANFSGRWYDRAIRASARHCAPSKSTSRSAGNASYIGNPR